MESLFWNVLPTPALNCFAYFFSHFLELQYLCWILLIEKASLLGAESDCFKWPHLWLVKYPFSDIRTAVWDDCHHYTRLHLHSHMLSWYHGEAVMCEDMGGGSSGRGDLLTQVCILRKLFFCIFLPGTHFGKWGASLWWKKTSDLHTYA